MENHGEFSSFLRDHNIELRGSHFHVQSSARFKFEAKAAVGGIDCESFAQGIICATDCHYPVPNTHAYTCTHPFAK